MDKIANIYTFETENFRLEVNALEEYDLDLSYMEDDDRLEVVEKINSGYLYVFCAQALLIYKETGQELACDYLGGCIYENFEDFRDNLGLKKTPYGSYFSDMCRTVLKEGRKTYNSIFFVKLNH